jgi:hypothetical protein
MGRKDAGMVYVPLNLDDSRYQSLALLCPNGIYDLPIVSLRGVESG